MKVTGLVPAMDGTDRLVEIELEITDPVMIEKIQRGLVKDLSLDPKPAQRCKHINRKTFNTRPPHIKCLDCGSLIELMDKKEN